MKNILATLSERVQHNCHITDATHAGQYTLCIYLLKMREYFRWETGRGFDSPIDKEQLGQWLIEREGLWLDIEGQEYHALNIAGNSYEPFATQAINQKLEKHGLVYSAGYGNKLRPHFFLAQLEKFHKEGDYSIYVTGTEYARDLTAPPAMAQGNVIFLRRESFRRMLWEKYEEWKWNKPDNAMKRAIEHYPFASDVLEALEQMTSNELNMALLHEIGEVQATALLGQSWREILSRLPRSKAEIMLRAVKDHLADSLSTLPALLSDFRPESLHFYIANLTSMRKTIAPGLMQCYQQWLHKGGNDNALEPLKSYNARARQHWLDVARQVIILREEYLENKAYVAKIANLVEQSYL
ncbi:MAG: hypothetical protein QNL62_23425 [Gammaproteobacteria bacterium]|nr:hypothetical protein [Gammaproteobacteria bacterium]